MKWRQILFLVLMPWVSASGQSPEATNAVSADGESKIAVVFIGGHETDGRDRGRPVVLVAAALGVPADVFRQAFTQVRPALAGQQPEPGQVRLNKEALLRSLGPYGVTNERLDEVSNYYRYRRETGELWRHTDAQAVATVRNGIVIAVTITDAGAGYSSVPQASVPGLPNVVLTPVVSFETDLGKNGSLAGIKAATP